MASALDAVLQLKSQEAARQQQASDNLTQGLSMLQNAVQQSKQNQFQQLQYNAGLAEKGLISDSTKPGGFRYDPTLTSPLANILTATKLQADAKTAGNKSVYDMAGGVLSGLTGGNSQIQIPQSPAITPGSPIAQAIAPSVSSPVNNSPLTITGQTSQTDPITGLTTGTTTSTNLAAKTAEKMAEGIPQSSMGLYNLAKESISNVDKTMSTLFPKGTPESFDRNAAFQSNTPNIKLPVIGQVGPSYIPTEKGQDIYRWMGNAISARQLIQTGVAARPDETQRLLDAFVPNGGSNSKSSFKAMNELRDFYTSFNHDLKTLGLDDLQKKYPGVNEYLKNQSSQSQKENTNFSFSTEAEASKAGLADGTPITINGVKGKWSSK